MCKLVKIVFLGLSILQRLITSFKEKCDGCLLNLKQSIIKYFSFLKYFIFFKGISFASLTYAILLLIIYLTLYVYVAQLHANQRTVSCNATLGVI